MLRTDLRRLQAAVIRGLMLAYCLSLVNIAQAQNTQALSSDGKWAAYIDDGVLWVAATAGGATPKRVDAVEAYFTVPQWAPNSRWLGYYATWKGTLQLWLYDVVDGSKRRISAIDSGISPNVVARFDGWTNDPLRFSWSPDSQRIALATDLIAPGTEFSGALEKRPSYPSKKEIGAGAPIELTTSTPARWTLLGVVSYGSVENQSYNERSLLSAPIPAWTPAKRSQILVIDVATGRAQQLTHDDRGYFTPDWSPDGGRLAFMSAGTNQLTRFGTLETNIFTLELATGKIRQVSSGPTQKMLPRWSHDGNQIAFRRKDARGRYFRLDEGIDAVSSGGELPSAGSLLTPRLDRWILSFAWAADDTRILVTYRDGLFTPLAGFDVRTTERTLISGPRSVVRAFAASQGGVVWSEVSSPQRPATLQFSGSLSISARTLTTLAGTPLRRGAEVVEWKNSRGDLIEGMLFYPEGYRSGRNYPVIVDAYSAGTMDTAGFEKYSLMGASADFFVFRPNHRSPHMWLNGLKSASYDAAAVGPAGVSVMTDDILSGVKMLGTRGLIDTQRMCVFGHSNGGLQGELLLANTKAFRCGAFHAAATSNWMSSFFLSTDDPEAIHWLYGLQPWKYPESFMAISPVFQADKIDVPVLLTVGDRDVLVLPTIEMYNVLRFTGATVSLVRYPNEGHTYSESAKRDFTRRLKEFFSKYLQSEPSGPDRNATFDSRSSHIQ